MNRHSDFYGLKYPLTLVDKRTAHNMNDNTTCAYVDWYERWRTETGPTDWVVPDEEVIERARAVHAAGARRALDLG